MRCIQRTRFFRWSKHIQIALIHIHVLVGRPSIQRTCTSNAFAFKFNAHSSYRSRYWYHNRNRNPLRVFSSTNHIMPENWSNESMRREALRRCILPLSPASHKGSSGRVGVLGGSARYTGAPYYAAMASLKTGADLAFVFCAQEAAVPIKSYSPELMVAPVYSAADCDQLVKNGEQKSDEAE
jgi:hypothetical protein